MSSLAKNTDLTSERLSSNLLLNSTVVGGLILHGEGLTSPLFLYKKSPGVATDSPGLSRVIFTVIVIASLVVPSRIYERIRIFAIPPYFLMNDEIGDFWLEIMFTPVNSLPK